MSFTNSTACSGDDDDEDIVCVSSDNCDQSYSDKFDSDVEEELYQRIYYSPQTEPVAVTDVSTGIDLSSSSNVEGGTSRVCMDRKKVKAISRKKNKVAKGKSRRPDPPASQPTNDELSDDSIIFLDSWHSSSSDLLTNMKHNGNSYVNSDSDSSVGTDRGNGDEFTPVISLDSSTDDSYSSVDSSSDIKLVKNEQGKPNNLWHVDPEDANRSYKNSKRYYLKSTSVCRKCRETGHTAKECRSSRIPKCYLCGGEHIVSYCQNKVCGSCFKKGHGRAQCSEDLNCVSCGLCKVRGHSSNRCPDIWRRYHLTTKPGSRIVKTPSGMKENKASYCYNCGGKGHFGHQCIYLRFNSHPSSPYVISYEEPGSFHEDLTPKINKTRHGQPAQRLKQNNLGKKLNQCTPQTTSKKNNAAMLKLHDISLEKVTRTSNGLIPCKSPSKKQLKRQAYRLKQKKKYELKLKQRGYC